MGPSIKQYPSSRIFSSCFSGHCWRR